MIAKKNYPISQNKGLRIMKPFLIYEIIKAIYRKYRFIYEYKFSFKY